MKKQNRLTIVTIILILVFVFSFPGFAQDYERDHILVCFQKDVENVQPVVRNQIVQSGFRSFDALCQAFGVTRMERWLTSATENDIDGEIKLMNIYRLKLSGNRSLEDAITAFAKNEWIYDAEYEYIDKPDVFVAPYTPNDPSLPSQWYISKTMADWAWGLWTIFGQTPADSTIVVGVVDSGVQWDHPDLMANIWVNPAEDIDGDGVVGDFGTPANGGDEDGVDNDGNGKIDDLIGWDLIGYNHNAPVEDNNPMPIASNAGHGTMVSGCASGVADNGIGIAGVGYRIKILPVKCGADDGDPNIWRSTDGVLYAARTGADIINCSFGNYFYSGFAQSVYNTAYNVYGALTVASAGNDGLDMDLPGNAHYPSNYNNVICVAGTNSDDSKAGDSNYGSAVDISAPYSNIYTTAMNSGYTSTGGTSFSSPITAGSLALLKSMYPDSGQVWLEDHLKLGADNIDAQNPNYIGKLGAGRVNSFNATGQPMFPKIIYMTHTMQILNDDGDGLLNPGEGAKLRITLKDETHWRNVDNLDAVLRCSSALISIVDSTANYGSINNGSIKINITDPFEFYVDSLAGNGDYQFSLYVKATSGSQPLYENILPFTINVSAFQLGWPIENLATIQSSPVLVNALGTDTLEVFTGSNSGDFLGWNYLGIPLNNFPLTLGGQMWGSPAFGDIDNDGNSEIVIGSSQGHLYVISPDGTIEHDWNIGEFIYGTVSLADLNNDDDLEIIFGTFSGNIQVLNPDGSNFGNFPYAMGTADRVTGGCAVADINGDGSLEIIAGTQARHIYALDVNANVLPGFPYNASNSFIGSVVVADLDGSGSNGARIIAGSQDGKLVVLKSDGTEDFIFDTGGILRSTAGLCDIDGDGTVEIFIGNNNKQLYGLKWDGSAVPGFPLSLDGNVEAQPVFADLYGNGHIIMLVTAMDGKIYGYDFTSGGWANGYPSPIAGQIKSTPTIADIDLDNDLEIAFGTSNSFAVLDIKQKNGSAENFWSTFQANYHRTGFYGDAVLGLKNRTQPIATEFQLMQNYPNPFNPETTIRYSLKETAPTRLEIYSILGEKIATLVSAQQKPGEYTVRWNAKEFASGIYIYRLTSGTYTATRRMLLLK